MTYPALYRRRLIPDECILLKDDIVLEWNEDRIVTSWKALHPKKDLHHGSSCYFLKEGFKVSEFLAEDGSLLYWYCDIVSYDFDKTQNTMIVTDLLADVIIYPDGFVKVVDLDELVTALDCRSLSLDTLKASLRQLDKLLHIIYGGQLNTLTYYITQYH